MFFKKKEKSEEVKLDMITTAGGERRPRIVCLCGSTKFWKVFEVASFQETAIHGRIVLSIGAASGTDEERFGNLPKPDYEAIKQELDELHRYKILMADDVLILNVNDYIGDSTRSELAFARSHSKRVRWWRESEHALPEETADHDSLSEKIPGEG